MKIQQFLRATLALAGWSLALSVWAFGEKPVRLIVPAPPGGTMDIVARVLSQQMSIDMGRPVIVENRPGAGGSIGLQAMLQAAPDGNTLVLAASNVLAETPQLVKMPFDPLKDVVPIGSLARSGIVLVTAASYPAKDFAGLVAQLKARKGKSSFASYSPGTTSQYAGLILSDRAGLDLQHVGYAGSPPALQDILGGQVDIMFDGMVTSMPLIRGGKLRPYAFTGNVRSRYLPDIPTTTELGFPDLQFRGWVGVIGSSKLPPDVMAKLHATIDKAARSQLVQQKLVDVGLEPEVSVDTPALMAETRTLSERNAAIVKKYNIQAN